MKCLAIAVFAVVVAVEAAPYGIDPLGMSYAGAHNFLHSGFAGGNGGYSDQGYGHDLLSTGHDIGHHENDFDSAVHQHQSEGHDVGGTLAYGNGGHDISGYGSYGAGNTDFGNGWNNGFGSYL